MLFELQYSGRKRNRRASSRCRSYVLIGSTGRHLEMDNIVIPKSFTRQPYAADKFAAMVHWARHHHPFYQERLADAEVPLLTRADILENNEELLNGHPVTAKTSGSTGMPVQISWSPERQEAERIATNRFVGWLGGRLPVSRIINFDTPPGIDSMDVSAPVAEQVSFLCRRYNKAGAVAVTTYPSNAERICYYVLDRGLDMSFIRRFGVFAEVFEEYQEELIRQAFPDAQVWSTYSSQELGMIAGRCPHNPKYHHVMAGKLGVEILDENNEPCREGVVGRLVITDFFNKNSPLIRYSIGDLAAWGGECPCGLRAFPALSKVLGKIRGTLLHKNGERVPFTRLSAALRDIPGMRQYQVIQHAVDQFNVKIAHIDNRITPVLQEQVRRAFLEHFGYYVEITIYIRKEIKRGSNGKFYASICKI